MQLLFFLICALFLVGGALMGFFRRTNRMVVRLLTLLLSLFGAFWLAKIGIKQAGPYVVDYLVQNYVTNAEYSTYIAENPGLVDSLIAVCQMLLGPLFFSLSYVLLAAVSWIVYKVVCIILHLKGPKKLVTGRVLGAGVGLLCGAVGMIVLITPVCGYTRLATKTLEQLGLSNSKNQTVMQVQAACSVGEAPLASTVYDLAGDKLFSVLSTGKWSNKSVNLEQETSVILDLVAHIRTLTGKPIAEFGEQEAQAVEKVVQDVGESAMLSHLSSGVLAGVSKEWLNGNDFFGLARPTFGEDADGIVSAFLEVFSTTDADKIDEDLSSFSDVFNLMVRHGIFPLLSEGADSDALVRKLTEGAILVDFYAVLDRNPRMQPVKSALADTGVRIMLRKMGVPEDLAESHNVLLDDMSGVLKNSVTEQGTVDSAVLKTGVDEVLTEHEIHISDSATELVCDAIEQTFTAEELQTLSTEEMVERLAERFGQVAVQSIPQS